MAREATLTVYSGNEWISVSGRIVKEYENGGCTIDTDAGIRWYASKERTQLRIDMRGMENKGLW